MSHRPLVSLSIHAQVRYLERCVDKRSVVQARKVESEDAAVLATLEERYARELTFFGNGVIDAIASWAAHAKVPEGRFKVSVGEATAVIVNGICVTALPKRRDRPVRDSRNGPISRRPRSGRWELEG